MKYAVLGKWPESLWKSYKLSSDVHDEYHFACRDGVMHRKRNLGAVVDREDQVAMEREIAERTQRIRSNPRIYSPFPRVAEVDACLGPAIPKLR